MAHKNAELFRISINDDNGYFLNFNEDKLTSYLEGKGFDDFEVYDIGFDLNDTGISFKDEEIVDNFLKVMDKRKILLIKNNVENFKSESDAEGARDSILEGLETFLMSL